MNKKPRVQSVEEAAKVVRVEISAAFTPTGRKVENGWRIYVLASEYGWTAYHSTFEEAFDEIKSRRK